jgi:hypothetical protein
MVISKRLRPTKEEVRKLVRASRELALGKKRLCPRCGKELILDIVGSSYTVMCSDEKCIETTLRGI